jgi:two-component system, LuxR family, response regulator FixJ
MPSDAYVCVIDDDDAMRDSLSFLLDTAGITVRAYESAAAFLAAPPTDELACIIIDVRMPGMSGTELLRNLKESGRRTPIIVMTGHGDIALAVEAMKLGAADFIEKPFVDEIMLAAVRAAIERRATNAEVDAEKAAVAERLATLSARERQVLDGLVGGSPNKTIAYDLGISPRTVEVYRANLMAKMQAKSLSDLVRMALLAGGLSN